MLGWLPSVRFALLILVLLAIIPAVGLSIYNASERRQRDGAEAQRDALTLVRLASVQEEQLIRETRQLLSFLAMQREVQEGDPDRCSTYLAGMRAQYPFYTGIGVADLNGDVYCSSLPRAEPAVNVADLPHFQGTVQSRDYAIGNYHIGRATGHGVLPFAYPLSDREGNLIGVIVATLDLGWLNDFVSTTPLPPGSSVTVLDRNGTVLARFPDPEGIVGQSVSQRSLFLDMAAASGDGTGTFRGLEGISKLYAFTRLGDPDQHGEVYFSIGIPESVAYAPANQALQWHLLGLGVALILTLGIAWFGSDLIIMRRVRVLVDATGKLASGDFKSRTGLKPEAGEFGLVGAAFDRMAQEIEEREEERARRIREEAQRAESEAAQERIARIVEGINDAFLALDHQGRFTYLNHKASQVMQQLTGKTREGLIGQDFSEELPHFLGGRIHEKPHGAVTLHESVQFEEFCPQLQAWLKVRAHPTEDGLSIFLQDITQRKQAEEAVRESEERFRLMVNRLPLIVWMHDAQGSQQFVNQTFCEFFGISEEEMRGGQWHILMHPDDAEAYAAEFLDCTRERRPFHAEVRVRRADGEWRWIESWGNPRFSASGEYLGFIGTSADITDRKEADQNKDEFLALLGHELRNPLAVITAELAILDVERRNSNVEVPWDEALDVLRHQSSHLIRLVDDLLDVTRISRGSIQIKREPVDLTSMAQDVILDYRSTGRSVGLTLELEVPQEPVYVMGDRDRLTLVLSNLISNSCKFTPSGGKVRLKVGTENDDTASIVVQDTGMGASAEVMPRLFEPFSNAAQVINVGSSGLGLGLALVKGIVELHGGTVEAHSEGPGKGFTVTVRLALDAGVDRNVATSEWRADT